ncbi:prolyl oligopeptidase family serine peptidase [Roseateles sp. NT4]|uniref:S9 family peptidase n=1 Tax=Roseateles sp. NT4 TaxID=3453715 RepID=UPI003EE84E21
MKTFTRAGAIAGFLLAASCAQAAPPPAEVFYKDADIAEAVLSPSGKRLAITSAKGVQRIGLVVLELGPNGKLARVAQFTDGDVWHVQWVNEDRLVFGVMDLSDGSGRPHGAPGLYAVNADGSQFRQLVRRMGKPFISNGEEDRLLSWNHRLLQVPAARAGTRNDEVLVVEFTSGNNYTETPMWLNTRTGRSRDTDFNAPPNTVGWLTDSRGEPRVAFTRNKDRQAAFWRDSDAKGWTQLYEGDLINTPFSVVSADDAGGLYVTRSEGPQGYRVLKRYDFEHHAPEAKPLVVTPGFDFTGHIVSDDNGKTLGVRLLVDGETTVWFDEAMKTLQERTDRLLPNRVNSISCRRCGAPNMVALVRSSSDRDPGRLFLYQAQPAEGEKPWTAIGPVRDGVKPEQMAALDLHRITARDGRELPVWVTKDPAAKGPLPAVVLVHGGPWVRGSYWGWHADAQFLASRGYAVIEPEMRGSTGYGDAHFRAGFKQFGQAMQDDVADALKWAQAQGIASDKACIAGASYGGYSTLMGLIKDPGLYRCGVAWVALSDLDLYLSGSWWISDDISKAGRQYTLPEMVGDPVKDAELIAANSPVKQAARIKAPLLLAFGEADLRVPLAHGERLRKAMREAGNDPAWVTYPGEGHGFAVLKNRADFAERMEKFLAKHLGSN